MDTAGYGRTPIWHDRPNFRDIGDVFGRLRIEIWCRLRDSNPRPTVYKTSDLLRKSRVFILRIIAMPCIDTAADNHRHRGTVKWLSTSCPRSVSMGEVLTFTEANASTRPYEKGSAN